MYMRIYNEQLVCVYEEEDLKNSEIIGKIKGRFVVGFSIREEDKIHYHNIRKIRAKELQLIIRNRETVTIAIEMEDEEILDYFYDVVYKLCLEDTHNCCNEERFDECMNSEIDSGIVKSEVFYQFRTRVIERLKEEGIFR